MVSPDFRAYAARWAGLPWEWGAQDCCTFAADWVREQTGRDPMADLRGRYGSAGEADRLIAAAGGLVVLFRRAAASGPICGACVVTAEDGREMGGIVQGEAVYAFTERRGVFRALKRFCRVVEFA